MLASFSETGFQRFDKDKTVTGGMLGASVESLRSLRMIATVES